MPFGSGCKQNAFEVKLKCKGSNQYISKILAVDSKSKYDAWMKILHDVRNLGISVRLDVHALGGPKIAEKSQRERGRSSDTRLPRCPKTI